MSVYIFSSTCVLYIIMFKNELNLKQNPIEEYEKNR